MALGGCAAAQAQRLSEQTPRAGSEPAVALNRSEQQLQLARAEGRGPLQSGSQDDATELLAQAPLGRPDQPTDPGRITSVKVFNLDGQCDRFEGEVVTLAAEGSLEEAVGLAIANSNNPDFAISSYRVNDGRFPQEVIVDLRLAPDSERLFTSLSVCEGQALFGSIRRTLVENGQFDVTQVQFTAADTDIFR